MRIQHVAAKNFRTLENFEISLNSAYCALSGKNNAGKTALVRVIRHFLDGEDSARYEPFDHRISFTRDFTQWVTEGDIEVNIELKLDRESDSEAFFVVETYAKGQLGGEITVGLRETLKSDGGSTFQCMVDDKEVEGQGAAEILKKIRSADNFFVYNSTQPSRRIMYLGDSFTEVVEAHFSEDDRRKISEAQRTLQTRVKKAAKQHKDDLDRLLGKLADKYHVELTTVDRGRSSRFPLEVKLNDRSVEVPLNDWGAGTQNRTRVLMAVLEAVRIRETSAVENRSTPVFVVEEPESFLHPSAQAEFGQVLNNLASELQIQIIATTHSPYMLNQAEPAANILLDRKIHRKVSARETFVRDTAGEAWMLPFAENLGVVPNEFSSWEQVFRSTSGRILLVEGVIDAEYFQHIKEKYPDVYRLPEAIDVVPYEGTGSLKNTAILKFMVSKFSKVFITYDLDAQSEVKPSLERIGLREGSDFCSIGKGDPGCDNIEGLVPPRLKKAVYARRHDLVTALTSTDTKARNAAKNDLKKEILAEFKKASLQEKELADFRKVFTEIARAYSSSLPKDGDPAQT